MNNTQANTHIIGRRGELLAELFLQDLNPSFVAKPTPDFGYDFFIGFPNANGGINNYAVEVKATERPVPSRFSINTKLYERLANSNIPTLLLVVDVKQNRLFYAWLSPQVIEGHRKARTITIPVTEVDDVVKEKLRQQLAGEQVVRDVQAKILAGN
ncbi:MAG: DUF4365 domain-containing protein [bacterium]|nr:DUF4365 domain-containing protein [bacterium]